MTREEKIDYLRDQLERIVPDVVVTVEPEDENLRAPFVLLDTSDTGQSRRLTIPRAALDDLDPSEILNYLQCNEVEAAWATLGTQPFNVDYIPLNGLGVPFEVGSRPD